MDTEGKRGTNTIASPSFSTSSSASLVSSPEESILRSSSMVGLQRLSSSISSSTPLSGPLERIRSELNLDQILPFGGAPPSSNGKLKETYFCEICFSYDDIEKGFILRLCGHHFCKECLTGWLTSKIIDGQVDLHCFAQIKEEDKKDGVPCDVKIREEDILACVPGDIAEKYHRFKENLLNPHTRQCSKCGFSQGGDQKNPIMTCETCGHKYCYTHGDQHPTTTCAEYESTHRRENLINAALIAKIAKPCPKCKSPIQKRSGCNHMKCPKCHASFCWLCGEEVEDKPFPEHFKETNLTSGCRGKQFGQQEIRQFGLCGRCISAFFLLFFSLHCGHTFCYSYFDYFHRFVTLFHFVSTTLFRFLQSICAFFCSTCF